MSARGDRRGQLGRQLALLLDALEDRGAPLLELAQVVQPLFERAQLRVVEAAGRFLAVARDERDGGFVVEQRDGGVDLRHTHVELFSDALGDGGTMISCGRNDRL